MVRVLVAIVLVMAALATLSASAVFYAFYHFGRGLPDYQQLADYQPPVVTRVHAGDGRLIAEFAIEKRVFVPMSQIPRRVIQAFLASEDKNFYNHPGVDFFSVVRAAIANISRQEPNKRPQGASTITQQVAKNFLLTNEVSISRKAKEAILAFRIERTFTKEYILELYLNEIYLGFGSYGVAAAALNYFNKSLDDLSIGEVAYLASLPKAPNNYHPVRHPEAARTRRDYVVGRMQEDSYITADEVKAAVEGPVRIRRPDTTEITAADYFAEEVRRQLLAQYGEKGLYGGGLSVRTTLDPRLQKFADQVLRAGLIEYDRRHGWRGPLGRIAKDAPWQSQLASFANVPEMAQWKRAVVRAVDAGQIEIGVEGGLVGHIPFAELKWARANRKDQRLGPSLRHPDEVVAVGDVILVEEVKTGENGRAGPSGIYALRQIPDVGGGLVALDPHTGRVLAMSGGLSFSLSQYNRVTQAKRQPGSAFKPFVYLAALDRGFTPSSLILDAPFVLDQGPGLPKWRPSNYSHDFAGPSTLRLGIEKSRNLMTVRLAQSIGIDAVAETAERFGIVDEMPRLLSMVLGAGETTLLRMTAGYAMFVNGGKRITPTVIDRVQDRTGRTIYRHDERPCVDCSQKHWREQDPPSIADSREQIADPLSAFQMVNILHGVVERGTGVRIRSVGKPLAGKTGTTNDSNDAWFVGFSPDLAVGVYVGFDQPRTLGPAETGASVAVPVFRDFMAAALEGKPAIPFRVPPGIRLVRVNAQTGLPAREGEKQIILEAFRPGSEPTTNGRVLDGSEGPPAWQQPPTTGPGGVY